IGTEPSFWQERLRRVEISRVSLDAVGMKGDLRPLRNDPTKFTLLSETIGSAVVFAYHFPSTFVPAPLFTERCDPLGIGGRRRRLSLLCKEPKLVFTALGCTQSLTCIRLAIPSGLILLRLEALLQSGRRRRLPPVGGCMLLGCTRGNREWP